MNTFLSAVGNRTRKITLSVLQFFFFFLAIKAKTSIRPPPPLLSLRLIDVRSMQRYVRRYLPTATHIRVCVPYDTTPPSSSVGGADLFGASERDGGRTGHVLLARASIEDEEVVIIIWKSCGKSGSHDSWRVKILFLAIKLDTRFLSFWLIKTLFPSASVEFV